MVRQTSLHAVDEIIDLGDRHAALRREPTVEAELGEAAAKGDGVVAEALGELFDGDAGGWS